MDQTVSPGFIAGLDVTVDVPVGGGGGDKAAAVKRSEQNPVLTLHGIHKHPERGVSEPV